MIASLHSLRFIWWPLYLALVLVPPIHAAVNFLTPVRWTPTTIGYADGHTEVLPRDDKRDGVITGNAIDSTSNTLSLNAFTSAEAVTVGSSPRAFYVRDGVGHINPSMLTPEDAVRAFAEAVHVPIKGVVRDCTDCKTFNHQTLPANGGCVDAFSDDPEFVYATVKSAHELGGGVAAFKDTDGKQKWCLVFHNAH